MAEQYPSALPGALVVSNGYTPQDLVDSNDLSSGPPIFRARSDEGWMVFSVAFSYSAVQVQLFRSWYFNAIRNGSKLFTIELMVEGWDGTNNTVTHECYFQGPPNFRQNGRRWSISASLLSISRPGVLSECDGISLGNILCGFDNPHLAIDQMNEVSNTLEDRWSV